jgi:4-hydroxymandelate oxidase
MNDNGNCTACNIFFKDFFCVHVQRAMFSVGRAYAGQDMQLNRIASINEFEALARDRFTRMAYDYVAGGVGNEVTLRANVEAWDRIPVRPRLFIDVSAVDDRISLFGERREHPILLAPTAYHRLYHPVGELETVRGAAASHSTLVASSYSTVSIEDMAEASNASLWFQLYSERDREFTKELVQRAEAAGCRALCLTVDQPVRGYRDRDIRNAFTLPADIERANLRGLGEKMAKQVMAREGIYNASHDPCFTLRDLEWLLGSIRIPLLVKGVMTPEAAEDVIQAGVAGIIVSNHGGRSLDTLPATADVLPRISDKVAGRVPLVVDGGIRRGTDVLKAIALGASAVLIGRPYVYALGVAGAAGIERVIEILRTELKMSMAMSGYPTIGSITRELIWTAQQ